MKLLDVGTVVLNWNGVSDTLGCLASIYAQTSVPAHLVLVDNGSTDGSVSAVLEWLNVQPSFVATEIPTDGGVGPNGRGFVLLPRRAGSGSEASTAPRLTIIQNRRNVGFARGNNVGIHFLLRRGVKYVMLLNNDTVVEDDAIGVLAQGMEQSPGRQCLIPQIRYWGERHRIWNCGGEWTWYGIPRYHYPDRDVSALGGRGPFEVSFVTGCAVMIRATWLERHGVLTERFFFGEEDVELSWRMRRSGRGTMGCWPASVIYHRLGASISKMAERSLVPRLYSYYVNRMIFLRTAWGRGLRWHAWRMVFSAHVARLLVWRFRMGAREALAIVRDLLRDGSTRDGVSAEFFVWMMKEKFPTFTPAFPSSPVAEHESSAR